MIPPKSSVLRSLFIIVTGSKKLGKIILWEKKFEEVKSVVENEQKLETFVLRKAMLWKLLIIVDIYFSSETNT